MKKRVSAVFFIFLVFHIGLIIPKTKFESSCHVLSPEAFSPCCNCPYCVGQRGGFLSACSCHERTKGSAENLPLIKRAFCCCGSSSADFDLPGVRYPILLGKNKFLPPALEIHPFSPTLSTLSSQVYLTPLDHPS